jgi:hypothetical protein
MLEKESEQSGVILESCPMEDGAAIEVLDGEISTSFYLDR